VAAALLLGATSQASAEVRLDFDIPVIVAAGVNISDLTGSSSGVSLDLSGLHIPLPYVELAYQFGEGSLRGGFGLRSYTVLIEFIGWPMGYVELELDRLILRAELGGFGFFFLGVVNQIFVDGYTLSTVIPDLQISYAIAPWFRLGAGVLAVSPLGNFKNFGWLFYVNARFALTFK
jgi:hypothetical protein